jgi:predicted Zn finger-like uncharacterized protein
VKISCPACAAKYSIADEKVQDKLAKIRCRKCGTTIVIDGKVSPANVYAGEAGASVADAPQVSDPGAGSGGAGEYSVDFGDNDQRNMTVADLVAAYNAGQVTAETFVWAEGMADWTPLGQVPQIVEALHAASAPAAAQARAPAPEPAAPPWTAAETPNVVRAAAKPGGGRGSTADLFGTFESAGSESDVTTSAREPEPVAAPAPSPAASASGGTGARNESSVLFSLSALTAAAKPASTAASSSLGGVSSAGPSGTKEDSGLIDLKALTAAADTPAAMPLTPAPLGMAPPLGLAPPLGGGVEAQIAAPTAQPSKSKTGIFIGAGIAVAAIVIAGAIIITRQPPPPAPTAVATQPAPPPAPTPAPTPAPEEATTAKPPATGTGEGDKDKAPTAGAKKPTGGPVAGKAPVTSGDKKPPTTGGDKPASEKKPPATKTPCGCAPGDLQCAMKCAAKGG